MALGRFLKNQCLVTKIKNNKRQEAEKKEKEEEKEEVGARDGGGKGRARAVRRMSRRSSFIMVFSYLSPA